MSKLLGAPKPKGPDPALVALEQQKQAEEAKRKQEQELAAVDERRAMMAGLRGPRTLLSAGYAGYSGGLGARTELG